MTHRRITPITLAIAALSALALTVPAAGALAAARASAPAPQAARAVVPVPQADATTAKLRQDAFSLVLTAPFQMNETKSITWYRAGKAVHTTALSIRSIRRSDIGKKFYAVATLTPEGGAPTTYRSNTLTVKPIKTPIGASWTTSFGKKNAKNKVTFYANTGKWSLKGTIAVKWGKYGTSSFQFNSLKKAGVDVLPPTAFTKHFKDTDQPKITVTFKNTKHIKWSAAKYSLHLQIINGKG